MPKLPGLTLLLADGENGLGLRANFTLPLLLGALLGQRAARDPGEGLLRATLNSAPTDLPLLQLGDRLRISRRQLNRLARDADVSRRGGYLLAQDHNVTHQCTRSREVRTRRMISITARPHSSPASSSVLSPLFSIVAKANTRSGAASTRGS